MGAVYLVSDQRLGGKQWAMKEMSDAALIDPEEKQRAIQAFQNEANLLASLNHPNLTKVVDYFEEEGKHYLIMDYIEGKTFAEMLAAREKPFSEEEVVNWATQLCDVLDYLHSQTPPIIFRDLKPDNVMLDKDGQIKLIDFGIARLFKPGKKRDTASFGTSGYSPPEQYGKGQTDIRSDIFALGATLHQLITLRDPSIEPFKFPPVKDINPAVSDSFNAAIICAVELEPDARWSSTKEFAEALQESISLEASQPLVQVDTPQTIITQSTEQVKPDILNTSTSSSLEPQKNSHHPWLIIIRSVVSIGVIILAVLYFTNQIPTKNKRIIIQIPQRSDYLFTSNRDGKPEVYQLNNEGEMIRITNTPGSAGSWDPVRTLSDKIYFTSDRDGKREIYRLENTGEVTQVTNTNGHAESWGVTVSPRGKLMFISNRDGKSEIYRLDDLGNSARVTYTLGNAESWAPAISPTGQLLFVSNRSGRREIYRLDSEGKTTRVTNSPGNSESWAPVLSPGGKILFVSDRDGKRELYRIERPGNTVRVTNTPGNAESWAPTLTPSGRLLFTSNRDGKTDVYRLDKSGNAIRITNTPGQASSWTASEK